MILPIALCAVTLKNGKFIIMAESGFTGQGYGQAKAQEEALAAIPMEESISPMAAPKVAPGGDGPLNRPSQLPTQPVTTAADVVPRPNSPLKSPNMGRIMSSMLQLASSPLASPSTRRVVRAMQAQVPRTETE
jgi:hypothetical protein